MTVVPLPRRKSKRDDLRDLAAEDAKTEAEYQAARRSTKDSGRRQRRAKFIGMPLGFIADVCRLTEGRNVLVVAMLIWRRTFVEESKTVRVTAEDLADMGLSRSAKQWALAQLQQAGFVKITTARGKPARITLLWRA